MPSARGSEGAAVYNAVVYVIGGYDGQRLNTVESYDIASDTWKEEAPLLVGKSEPSVGTFGATIVAAGGKTASGDTGDTEGYDPSTNAWKSLASEPTGLNSSCTGAIGASLYTAGGSNSPDGAQNNTQAFMLTKDKWTTLADMPETVDDEAAAVYGGQLYCFGGGNIGTQFEGSVFKYVQIYQP
jgi:N-acetylneuraminic acid mutarotase